MKKSAIKPTVGVGLVLLVLLGLMVPRISKTAPAEQYKEIAAEGIVVSAISSEIKVSEADKQGTRVAAYLGNIYAVDSNGRLLSLEGGTFEGFAFKKGDITITFEENGEKVDVNATRNGFASHCYFLISEEKLRNEENENVSVNAEAFSPSFNEDGDRIHSGHVQVKEQDLNEKGEVIGTVNTDNIHTQDSDPDVKPSVSENKTLAEPKKDFVKEEKKKTDKATKSVFKDKNSGKKTSKKENTAGGADLGNVQDIPEENASADEATYRQISVAFATGEDTINLVAEKGGNGSLVLYCTEKSKNSWTCVTPEGETLVLEYNVVGGVFSFNGIKGTYR